MHERRTENEKKTRRRRRRRKKAAPLQLFALPWRARYATGLPDHAACTLAHCAAWVRTLVRTALRSSVASCVHLVDRCTPVLLLLAPLPTTCRRRSGLLLPSHARRTLATRTPSGVLRRRAFGEAVCCCAHCSLGARPFPFPCFCFSTC